MLNLEEPAFYCFMNPPVRPLYNLLFYFIFRFAVLRARRIWKTSGIVALNTQI